MTVPARIFVCCTALFAMGVTGCSDKRQPEITSADGVSIAYERHGDGSPAVIFIHGWGNDRSVWKNQLARFSDQFDVIGIDLPGFGESGGNRQAPTIESFGDDIDAVIRGLQLEDVVLVGFSMGALVAVDAAGRHPDKVIGVILVDQLHDVEAKIPVDQLPGIVDFYMGVIANPTREILLANGFYKNDTDESFEGVTAMLQNGMRPEWRDSLIDALTWLNDDCTTAVDKVEAPIIAINSDLEPTRIDIFRKYAPSFEAKIIPNTGHLVMWDAPEAFNEYLEESIVQLVDAGH